MDAVKVILWAIGLPLLGIGFLLIPLLLFRRFYAAKLKIPEGSLKKLGIDQSLIDRMDRNIFFVWYFGFTILHIMNHRMPFESILRWTVNTIAAVGTLIFIFRRFLLYFRAWKKTPQGNTDLRKVLFYYSIGCGLSAASIFLLFGFYSFLKYPM